MNRISRIISVLLLCVGAFLLLEKPAYADVFIFWNYLGSMAPLWFGVVTKGFALIVVILIEMVVFRRIWGFSWRDAFWNAVLLNVISSVVGAFIAGLYYAATPFVCLLPVIFVVCVLAAIIRKWFPLWFGLIAFITIIAGTYLTAGNTWIVDSLPAWHIFLVLMFPLILGFGITLVAEGWAAKKFLGPKVNWRAVFLANVWSYIFLALMMICVGPTPYEKSEELRDGAFGTFAGYFIFDKTSITHIHAHRLDSEDLIKLIQFRQSTNLELLGLAHYKPGADYDAGYEFMVLHGYFANSGYADPELGQALLEYSLNISTLNTDARVKLEWHKTYLDYRSRAVKAVKSDDQDDLNTLYAEWREWFSADDIWPPWNQRSFRDYQEYNPRGPKKAINDILVHHSSNLEPPWLVENDGDQ